MTTPPTFSNPPEIFISYAQKDEALLKKLETHLNVLKRQRIVTIWHGLEIIPGDDWEHEIGKHLSTAQIVLLLVSKDFLESDYCYSVEFKRAMERHRRGTARVIPVILHDCEWRDTPLGRLQALPRDARPVAEWDNIDKAFESVTEGIRQVVRRIPDPRTQQITIVIDEQRVHFDEESFKERLRDNLGVDIKRVTVSFESGSIKILIEGDNEELVRIVNALGDPESRRKLFEAAKLKSITYIQDQQEHSISLESIARHSDVTPNLLLIDILRRAISAVPAVKYALGVAGIAAVVAIVAGFNIDYKVAVLGTIIMLGLMFGLVAFSSVAFDSATSIRPLALMLAWTFVFLTSATSVCIFTGFFFDWPRPLEAYLLPKPSPSPTAVPSPTAEPSPTATITAQEPLITVTERPPYDPIGGRNSKAPIAGKVEGASPAHHSIVIYSFTNTWYVQPTTDSPRTSINLDGKWSATIQTGTTYAILLVPRDFEPPSTTDERPTQLPGVIKWMEIEGKKTNQNSR